MAHKAHICVERHKKQVTSISWVMGRGTDRANIPLIPSLFQQDLKKRPFFSSNQPANYAVTLSYWRTVPFPTFFEAEAALADLDI